MCQIVTQYFTTNLKTMHKNVSAKRLPKQFLSNRIRYTFRKKQDTNRDYTIPRNYCNISCHLILYITGQCVGLRCTLIHICAEIPKHVNTRMDLVKQYTANMPHSVYYSTKMQRYNSTEGSQFFLLTWDLFINCSGTSPFLKVIFKKVMVVFIICPFVYFIIVLLMGYKTYHL